MTNSNQKGKRGEREAAKAVSAVLGCSARRGQQFCGGGDSPDIVVDLPGVHFEVKRTERLCLYKAMKQASDDASVDSIPVVLHRRNKKDWLAIVPLEDLAFLAEKIVAFMKAK